MKNIVKTGVAALAIGVVGAGLWYLRADESGPSPATPAAATAPAAAIPPVWLPRVIGFLGLTADQRMQLAKLRDQHRAAVSAIRNDASLTPDQRRDKIRDETKSALADAGKLLTPDQLAKLQRIRNFVIKAGLRAFAERQEIQRERRFWGHEGERGRQDRPQEGWGQRPGMERPFGPPMAGMGRPPWAGGQDFAAGRHLTPEQRAKLVEITKAYREQVRAILAAPAPVPAPAPAP